MSTLSVGTIKSDTTSPPVIQNSSATEVGTFCRAWINFNGTGTVAIRADFNVATLTDNGVGVYTITFTTAMPDANYATICGISRLDAATNSASGNIYEGGTYSTSAVQVFAEIANGTNIDPVNVCVAIFR